LLAFEELLQLIRVNSWNWNVRAHAIDHQRQQQKDETATQVTELVVVANR